MAESAFPCYVCAHDSEEVSPWFQFYGCRRIGFGKRNISPIVIAFGYLAQESCEGGG